MRSYVHALAVAALLASGVAEAGWASFRLTEPIANEAGPASSYRLYWGVQPHTYTDFAEFAPIEIDDMVLDDLPDVGSVYVVAVAVSQAGVPSEYSNIACFTLSGPACLPAPFRTDVLSVVLRDPGSVRAARPMLRIQSSCWPPRTTPRAARAG